MMDLLRIWLTGVIAVALLLSVIYALLPAGKLRSVVRFTGGLVLLLAVLRPLVGMDTEWEMGYEDCAREIQEQIGAYQEENLKQARDIIAEQVAAYISDKGQQLGISCHPRVMTQLRDGVPYPDNVTMDIPLQQELADYIADTLGIPAERQIWQER